MRKSGEALDEVGGGDHGEPASPAGEHHLVQGLPAACCSDGDTANNQDLEFPQINHRSHNARPYRDLYGCGFRHLLGDALIKMDVGGKSMKVTFQLLLRFQTASRRSRFLSRFGNQLASSSSPPQTPPRRTAASRSQWRSPRKRSVAS